MAVQNERQRSELQEEDRPEGRLLRSLERSVKFTCYTHTHIHTTADALTFSEIFLKALFCLKKLKWRRRTRRSRHWMKGLLLFIKHFSHH